MHKEITDISREMRRNFLQDVIRPKMKLYSQEKSFLLGLFHLEETDLRPCQRTVDISSLSCKSQKTISFWYLLQELVDLDFSRKLKNNLVVFHRVFKLVVLVIIWKR